MTPKKPKKIRYDVAFINPFLEAVMSVLGTMANVAATPGKPFVNAARTAIGDVTGLIGITGHSAGTMSLTLSKGAILLIVNNMLHESYTDLNDDIADAVGELTNMIAGQARMHLSQQGLNFTASTPSVIMGKGHRLSHVSGSPILAIPFSTEGGDLVVEVAFADVAGVSSDFA
ncbi:MAG: chemotaxis protein CheX [Thermodesulfobacteriota bacterium]